MTREIEDEEIVFQYNSNFDDSRVRRLLELDSEDRNHKNKYITPGERIRLGLLLQRVNKLTPDDVEKLRSEVSIGDNPIEKKECPVHGEWYHDAFGCLHHDHTNPHPSDQPPIDKVCKH